LQAFSGLVEEKVEPEHSVMERMTMRSIDTEDMRTLGAFLKIGDVVLGKLLAKVESDHIKLG